MFKKVTKSVLNQTGEARGLVPVHSIFDHERFRPLCLVRRKRKAIFHPSPSYRQTCFKLNDVLLPGEDAESTESLFPNGDGQDSTQFTVQASTRDRIDGSLSLPIISTSVDVKGAASLFKGWSIKLEKDLVPAKALEALRNKRKINMDHSFIQQLKKTEQNLYVVLETIKASEETSYEESTEVEGSFMTQFYAKFYAKGIRENKQSITIPKDCTLAFRALQLCITDGSWYLDYFPEVHELLLASDGFSSGKLRTLEEEVKNNCQILSELSSDLFVVFLKAIKAVMRDRNLFQELSQKMEAVLDEPDIWELKTDTPDLEDLLISLHNFSRDHLLQLAEAITYILDALDELTEDQLLLLLESLEDKIVSQQLKLVENILEHDIEHRKEHFSVDASLLSFSQEKEQELTIAMVEMSGVKLQEDGTAVCTEAATTTVAALYVSLYILNLLSNSD
ncbi:gasdermin-A [Cariama cristata]